MSLYLNIIYSILFVFLSLETVFYQGFINKHFHINPYLCLLIYILSILIVSFIKKIEFNKLINKINNVLLPITIITYFIAFYIEKFTYKNFIFTHIHINFQIIIYLIIFSLTNYYLSTTPQDKLKKIFYLAPPLFFILFLTYERFQSNNFILFLQEDGIAEYTQFIFYSLSSFYFYKSATKSKKILKFIFIFLFIGTFFIAGEEISWGQRILGIETPESYKQINHQNETTIHNLEFIQNNLLHKSYMLIGLLGAYSYLLFRLFLPNSKFSFFAPEKFIRFGFMLTFVYYFFYDYFLIPNEISYGNIPLVRWQEIIETFLSFSFFGYSLNIYQKINQLMSKSKIQQKIELSNIK